MFAQDNDKLTVYIYSPWQEAVDFYHGFLRGLSRELFKEEVSSHLLEKRPGAVDDVENVCYKFSVASAQAYDDKKVGNTRASSVMIFPTNNVSMK